MTSAAQRAHSLVLLCVANSARSQMAEGLARASAPVGWSVFSAGSQPAIVHPLAIVVMEEIGIDITGHRSKGLDDVPLGEADFVITLCADEVCPVVPGSVHRLHWPLPDPASEGEMIRDQIEAFRKVRDEIKRRLTAFWAEHPE
ncbi:MAG: arsenate reductase ArsC [Gemmatimonadota bacterium]|nr:MAG: arsenate reductase ArsC [Gemmatimonadota bacterium]